MIGEDMEVEVIPESSAAPTKLSERRSTCIIATLEGPSGNPAIARTAANGHSGFDPPPRVHMKQDSVALSEKTRYPQQLQVQGRASASSTVRALP